MTEETRRLYRWMNELAAEIGTADLDVNEEMRHILLDLARDAAHQVVRPAAPLTSFLVGVAVGRGESLENVAAKATARILAEDAGGPEPDADAS